MDRALTPKRWVVALTGASGMRYAIRLLFRLANQPTVDEIHLLLSEAARRVLHEEEGIKISGSSTDVGELLGVASDKIILQNLNDIGASVASGSFVTCGMVVIPCSMSSLASIASGVQSNLIHRAADVTIKEGRRLVLVPRETPLSAIHLENMLKLARLGVAIVPAMPGFYLNPKGIEDLVDHQVTKVLDSMGIQDDGAARWS